MWYQIKSYLKFVLKATNQHGVHSPFVYDFVTKCLYDKNQYKAYAVLKSFRKKVFQNNEVISITDFGKGSRVFASNERKVSAIAKNAGVTQKRQQLLFRIANYFQPKTVLELGTSLGMGTAALSLGNTSANIITIEGCPNTAKIAKEQFEAFHLQNIVLQIKTFEDYFENNSNSYYDLVYIDGNHDKEKTIQYFKILSEKATNDSLFIFDDIYWSPAMTEAWQEIMNHSKVTVSIDTFYWGFIFFRKEQEKQHFVIRL
jgi:predicted O-methyltransferase YrrM